MFLRKLASERRRNFPPRLIGVSALPCKTGNTKITSCHVNVVFSFAKQIRKTCPTEIRNVWHLLRYCSKISCWLCSPQLTNVVSYMVNADCVHIRCWMLCVGHVCCIQLIVSWMKYSLSVTRNYTDIAVRSLTCHNATGTHMPHGITRLPATRQRWHSRLYPSQSWYSIKRPWRDVRLVGWLHIEMVYLPKDGHPSRF